MGLEKIKESGPGRPGGGGREVPLAVGGLVGRGRGAVAGGPVLVLADRNV